ncbi:MAG: hypothetical protein ACRDJE_06975 [Dehalococcoidia bacterium]
MTSTAEQEGFAWQTGIWDRMSGTYVREIDARFVPVIEQVLAGVTVAGLAPERAREAKAAVMAAMLPEPEKPREFRNVTQFIVGRRVR